jgi:hypothetical protein
MDRIWKLTLLLAIFLSVAWGWRYWQTQTIIVLSVDSLILVSALLAFMLTLVFLVARSMAYVQPTSKYLKVATPFMRVNISYKRVRGVRPVLMQQLFPKDDVKRSLYKTVAPYYGKTAVAVELKSFPSDPKIMKMFMPASMFAKQFQGMVFLVPDWMKLSTEVDSYRGAQQQSIKDTAWVDQYSGGSSKYY